MIESVRKAFVTLRVFQVNHTGTIFRCGNLGNVEIFEPSCLLTVNNCVPAVGRNAITEVAQSFMTAFPDMRVTHGPTACARRSHQVSLDVKRNQHRAGRRRTSGSHKRLRALADCSLMDSSPRHKANSMRMSIDANWNKASNQRRRKCELRRPRQKTYSCGSVLARDSVRQYSRWKSWPSKKRNSLIAS